MRRTLTAARQWTRQGTALLLKEADLGDAALNAPSALPGPLPEVAAYLTGRAHQLTTADGAAAPELPAWL